MISRDLMIGDIEAILRVHGVTDYLPETLKDREQNSVVVGLVNYCQEQRQKAVREIFEEIDKGRRSPFRRIPYSETGGGWVESGWYTDLKAKYSEKEG